MGEAYHIQFIKYIHMLIIFTIYRFRQIENPQSIYDRKLCYIAFIFNITETYVQINKHSLNSSYLFIFIVKEHKKIFILAFLMLFSVYDTQKRLVTSLWF